MARVESYAYDPTGKKVKMYIENGLTYTDDGNRIGAGYTVQTNGGIYKMGADGKGTKVESHNIAPVNTPVNTVNNSKDNLAKSLANVNSAVKNAISPTSPIGMALNIGLNSASNSVKNSPTSTNARGSTSGNTLASRGYDAFYDKEYKDLENRYNYFTENKNESVAKTYKDAMARTLSNMDIYNTFKDWNTNDLDVYIHNKMNWEKLNMDTKNTPYYDQATIDRMKGEVAKTKEQIEAENKYLRDRYGLAQDNYIYNDLGQLGADLIWGDFLKQGIDKSGGKEVSDILKSSKGKDGKEILTDYKTGDVVDPKFNVARMLARRDNLFGYEPIGKASGNIVDSIKNTMMDSEAEMLNRIANGQSIKDLPTSVHIGGEGVRMNTGEGSVNALYDSINKRFTKSDNVNLNANDMQNIIPVDANNPQLGAVYETPTGRMLEIDGQQMPLSDDDFVKYMEMILGF